MISFPHGLPEARGSTVIKLLCANFISCGQVTVKRLLGPTFPSPSDFIKHSMITDYGPMSQPNPGASTSDPVSKSIKFLSLCKIDRLWALGWTDGLLRGFCMHSCIYSLMSKTCRPTRFPFLPSPLWFHPTRDRAHKSPNQREVRAC